MTERILLDDPHAALAADDRLGAAAFEAVVTPSHRATLIKALSTPARRSPLERARALAVAARLAATTRGEAEERRLRGQALAAVGEAVAAELRLPERKPVAAIRPDETVWTSAPARIDLAGGWSDTPPICTEQGGTVLNAAVTLNGLYPVQVMAKLNAAGCIRLSSIDPDSSRAFSVHQQFTQDLLQALKPEHRKRLAGLIS